MFSSAELSRTDISIGHDVRAPFHKLLGQADLSIRLAVFEKVAVR